MKTIAFVIYLIISSVGTLFSQEYDFEVHVPCDSLQYGYGIEAGIRLMNYSGEDGIQFAVTTSGHLQWELHTDTLYEPGYTVLSLKADDVYFNGPVNVEITGIRQNEYLKK